MNLSKPKPSSKPVYTQYSSSRRSEAAKSANEKVFKDFTNDPSFKSHTDWAERLRREMAQEEESRQNEKDSNHSRNIIILTRVPMGHLAFPSLKNRRNFSVLQGRAVIRS